MGEFEKQSVYIQIVERIKRDIAVGIIEDGERLPSCREYAIKLGINPNTVQRAYAKLEDEGYLVTIPKKGVYAHKSPLGDELKKSCEGMLLSLKNSGLKKQELLEIVEKIFGGDNL